MTDGNSAPAMPAAQSPQVAGASDSTSPMCPRPLHARADEVLE